MPKIRFINSLVDPKRGMEISHKEAKRLTILDLGISVSTVVSGTLPHLFGYQMTPIFGSFPYYLYGISGAALVAFASLWVYWHLRERVIKKKRFIFIELGCYLFLLAGMLLDAAFHTRYFTEGTKMMISADTHWFFLFWLPLWLVNEVIWYDLHKRFTCSRSVIEGGKATIASLEEKGDVKNGNAHKIYYPNGFGINHMAYEIIPYENPAFAEKWAETHRLCWRETYKGLLDQKILDSRNYESELSLALSLREGTEFVAVADGDVIGMAGCLPESKEEPKKAAVTGLYVLKRWQNQGIGKALLTACLKGIGSKPTILWVLKGNQKAIAFYEHLGWKTTGKEKEEIIGGTAMNEEQMAKE
jgi:GNAT superfamily N-acetyltransferase